MPDQSKPKITIDDDGTIHVDNGENNSRSTTKAKSSKNNVGNRSSGASSKPTPLKTSAQIADEGLSDSSSAASKAKSRLDSSNQHTITDRKIHHSNRIIASSIDENLYLPSFSISESE